MSPAAKQMFHMEFPLARPKELIDADIYKAITEHANKTGVPIGSYFQECHHISSNMPLAISIDNFIDSSPENPVLALCGKMAIIKSILEAERKSSFRLIRNNNKESLNFSDLENTWYLPFFRTLTENCIKDDLIQRFENITLIIFNYDRCVEHFLAHALMSYYRLEIHDAEYLISFLNIIHPYGTVGTLDWGVGAGTLNIKFGGVLKSDQLVEYAESIRTFTEGPIFDYKGLLTKSMCSTERLVFLGYSFHPLNMKFLRAQRDEGYGQENEIKCFATAYGASLSDIESISKAIEYLYDGGLFISLNDDVSMNVDDITCTQLFKDYSRSLGYSKHQ